MLLRSPLNACATELLVTSTTDLSRTHLTKLDDTEDVNTIDSRRHCRPEEAQSAQSRFCCRHGFISIYLPVHQKYLCDAGHAFL